MTEMVHKLQDDRRTIIGGHMKGSDLEGGHIRSMHSDYPNNFRMPNIVALWLPKDDNNATE